ncbi:PIN domain-containing protein [Cupriavidus metallidurans]|uniref:PIN domain-containing protein n=1 Tax=Cupriavidus metallidurans TaxID=119219 RepID=UPI001BFC11F5|nr:type II toxin-antitoxin system VapC family toxin [Cupriavidus metallidurans]QWC90519.1 type II toxin-antitoxin system VapC family toxin [Cupriavidus metallidurans]
MIGLDACILVRFFAKDDPIQTPKAAMLLKSLSAVERGYVSTVALAELTWVMGRRLKMKRSEIARIVDYLINSKDLVVESEQIVVSALRLFEVSSVGFGDCLILQTCQTFGCRNVATFDRKAASGIGMRLIA